MRMIQPDLSFRGQQQALATAAEQSAVDNGLAQTMQAARGLMNSSTEMMRSDGPMIERTGITPEVLQELRRMDAEGLQARLDGLRGRIDQFGEYDPTIQATMSNNNSAANPGPQGDRESYLVNGLMKRGFTPEEAQAFVINMKDESGLRSSVTEAEPNVHGTRGQGLYQLTDMSPGVGRRSDYLNFMKGNGRNDLWSDESQMDFAWWERNNTEKANWDRVANIQGVGNKAAGIVRYVLRPAEKHRDERVARYSQLGY